MHTFNLSLENSATFHITKPSNCYYYFYFWKNIGWKVKARFSKTTFSAGPTALEAYKLPASYNTFCGYQIWSYLDEKGRESSTVPHLHHWGGNTNEQTLQVNILQLQHWCPGSHTQAPCITLRFLWTFLLCPWPCSRACGDALVAHPLGCPAATSSGMLVLGERLLCGGHHHLWFYNPWVLLETMYLQMFRERCVCRVLSQDMQLTHYGVFLLLVLQRARECSNKSRKQHYSARMRLFRLASAMIQDTVIQSFASQKKKIKYIFLANSRR